MKNTYHDWTEQGMFDYPADGSTWHDNHSPKNKKKKIPKSRKKRRKTIFVFLFILMLVVAFIAIRFFWKINHVIISGVGESETAQLMTTAGLKVPISFSEIDKRLIKQKIEADPHYIIESQKFEFPFTYRIDVHERKEYAVVQCLQQYVYIDTQGMVLDITASPKDTNVLIVRGLSASGFSVNENLAAIDAYQFYVTKEIFNAIEESGQRGWFSVVDVTNAVDISLFTTSDIWVHLGQPTNLKEKIMGAAVLLQELENEGQSGGKIEVLKSDSMVYAKEKESSKFDAGVNQNDVVESTPTDNNVSAEVDEIQNDSSVTATPVLTAEPVETMRTTPKPEETADGSNLSEDLDEEDGEINIDMIPEEVD